MASLSSSSPATRQGAAAAEDEERLEVVADRLRHNESGYSSLTVRMNPGYEVHDLNVLTQAIQANETLESVHFFGILADDDVNQATRRLVESFGTLPRLKSLQISGYVEDLIEVTSRILNQVASTLERLSIVYVQLYGPPRAFQALYRSLASLSQLESFRLVDCQFPRHLLNVGILDTIIQRVSQLAALKSLELAPIHDKALGDIPTDAVVNQLCRRQSASLQYLHIYGFQNGSNAVGELCEALQGCPAIQNVRLASSFGKAHCLALANLIQQSTSLTRLNLDLYRHDTQTDEHLPLLAQALSAQQPNNNNNNPTSNLTHLLVFASNLDTGLQRSVEQFGKALQHNYALQEATFCGSGPGFSMQHRFTSPRLTYYLQLNRLGRGPLLQNPHATRNDWIDKLVECNSRHDGDDDESNSGGGSVDCLFYFLSRNPSLCE